MKGFLTINCKGSLVDLTTPQIMGILNLTPDSFYDGGAFLTEKDILNKVELMLTQGATFIDVGGYSSRPNAKDISVKEEKDRVIPVIKRLIHEFPDVLISLDTFRSEVAQAGLDVGVAMINDISGGVLDTKMIQLVAQYNVPFIAMHMRGTPQTMQKQINYDNLLTDIFQYFTQIKQQTTSQNISDVIIDPGFGFAKNIDQNYYLLNQLPYFKTLNCPLLVGVSRKSMIYNHLKISPEHALNGTSALHMVALLRGANILRVHDVKECKEVIKLYKMLQPS